MAAKAEGAQPRASKKKARQVKQFRRVYTPTEEVLPAHQTFLDGTPESDVPYTPGTSRRVGAVALKCGMIPEWDVWGVRHVLTVLKVSIGRQPRFGPPPSSNVVRAAIRLLVFVSLNRAEACSCHARA